MPELVKSGVNRGSLNLMPFRDDPVLTKADTNMKRIKIGHQMQADLPMHLIASGKIVCGAFEYSGAKTSEFRGVFEAIASTVKCLPPNTEFDVSDYKFLDAMNIYEEYIARPWKKSISAQKMERLAVETEIFVMLEPLRAEFKRSVATKWKRIFREPLLTPDLTSSGIATAAAGKTWTPEGLGLANWPVAQVPRDRRPGVGWRVGFPPGRQATLQFWSPRRSICSKRTML